MTIQVRITVAALFALSLATSPAAAQIVGFEDVSVPATPGYLNNAGPSGQFVSGGTAFNNNFYTDFSTWSGWSVSKVTDVTTQGFTNQYAAYSLHASPPGSGDASPNYGVAFQDDFHGVHPTIQLPAGTVPESVRLTNTTYAALIMLDGDPNGFARQFDTAHHDFFKVTITGLNASNQVTGTVPFFLADYTLTVSPTPYVVSDWTTVDLTPLGNATQLSFAFASSDVGAFGINTPEYVALDNLTLAPVPEPGTLALVVVSAAGMGFAVRRKVRRGRLKP
jgi:hypothetical protein